jgi:hypothetical protein
MFSTNQATQAYILHHQNEDVKKLLLKKRTNAEIDYEFAFRQIAGRQRIKLKLPTFHALNNIVFPPQLNIEQSSSESTALYKKNICEGNTFIDITGGFGIDFHFISQKFQQAIYVERNEALCKIAEHNFNALGCMNTSIINADALEFIEKLTSSDCIFVDPARRDKSGGKTVFLADCEPDITQLYQKILNKSKMLLVKLSPMLDISAAINSLKFVCEVHIISVANECKEVLLVLRPNYNGIIRFYAVNIQKNEKIESYIFEKEKELEVKPEYTSLVFKYLYEPNSSILKAGAFKSVAMDFSLKKLHINTHLYTSDLIATNFPGRIFEVEKVWKTGKKELAELKTLIPKANLSTRNFPQTTEQLKKKTGIADGGDTYLFGCTLQDESKVIIECKKITSTI